MTDNLEFIKLLIEQWDNIKKIPKDVLEKINDLFKRGDKSLGFIRRKSIFIEYLTLSQKTFLKKYSKYIIPTEYRGFLLHAIKINELYEKGLKAEGDKHRAELINVNPKAIRLCNLYSSGILAVVFSQIDKMLDEGKNEEEIIGKASKILDNLINDKSIIYVNVWHNEEELYTAIKKQVKNTAYCCIYGAGQDNINKIKRIFSKIVDDKELSDVEIRHSKKLVGTVNYFSSIIYEKAKVNDASEG